MEWIGKEYEFLPSISEMKAFLEVPHVGDRTRLGLEGVQACPQENSQLCCPELKILGSLLQL